MSKYEITQAQWQSVMAENPSRFRGATLPVENVSWDDSREFCRRTASALPGSAQREYACRAGTGGSYGLDRALVAPEKANDPYYSVLEIMAWYRKHKQLVPVATNAVGTKPPNAFQIFDMHGNVWEWCSDLYEDMNNFLAVEAESVESSRGQRVIRGGYYGSPGKDCRCEYFDGSHVTDRQDRGLRPIRNL